VERPYPTATVAKVNAAELSAAASIGKADDLGSRQPDRCRVPFFCDLRSEGQGARYRPIIKLGPSMRIPFARNRCEKIA
jgi:hypothetical protein